MTTATATSRPNNGETFRNGKIDRVARFGWKIEDMPGRFQMIDKDLLEVDESYQREETITKVKAIAANWSWMACGVLTVAHRRERYLVMDGNHRAVAARIRSDIVNLPCFIFDTVDAVTKAKGFLRSNTFRKPMTSIETFKAQLLTGDPAAIMVDNLVRGTEYAMVSKYKSTGRTVRCVATMMRLAKNDPETLNEVWPLIVQCSGGDTIYDRVVDSLCFIEKRLKSVNPDNSLLRKPWCDRVVALGSRGVMDASARAASFFVKGGANIWAKGVVEALNKNVRHRLILDKVDQV